jgi:hypothetical protein
MIWRRKGDEASAGWSFIHLDFCFSRAGLADSCVVIGAVVTLNLASAPAVEAGFAVYGAAGAANAAQHGRRLDRDDSQQAEAEGAADKPRLIFVQSRENFTVADIVGETGHPIPLNISMPPFEAADYVLLSFRRLPRNFSLSSGFRAADAWLVSAHDVENLALIPPNGFVGTFKIEVQFVRGKNAPPLSLIVPVVVASGEAQRNGSSQRAPVGAIAGQPGEKEDAQVRDGEAQASAPAVKRVDAEEERRLLKIAAALLQQKDISAARLVYTRLARQGSIQGALTLGETFDPSFLSKYEIVGLQPNMAEAKHWYGVAAKLGSPDASSRLIALESGNR